MIGARFGRLVVVSQAEASRMADAALAEVAKMLGDTTNGR